MAFWKESENKKVFFFKIDEQLKKITLFLQISFFSSYRALYNGIVPGLQRQMAFSAIRIGGYETVKQKYTEMTGANTTFSILGVRIAAGITTGTLAILAAQPTDVCNSTFKKLVGQNSEPT